MVTTDPLQSVSPLPLCRALHPSDYARPELAPFVEEVRSVERRLRQASAPYRRDHAHREWEYANVLAAIAAHFGPVPRLPLRVLDTGSGASYLPPILALRGYDVTISDSMGYGDLTDWVIRQCLALDIRLPIVVAPVENLQPLGDETFDVTLCISVIEHIPEPAFWAAWDELIRVTKVGGLIVVTSDYFEHSADVDQSPYKQIQHSPFTWDQANRVRNYVAPFLEPLGGVDLRYRGHFVNNYSFISLVFRRLAWGS